MTTYYVTFPDRKATYELPEGETLPQQMIQNFEMMGVLYSTTKPDGWVETYTCKECECEFPEDDMNKHNDGYYCDECNPSANCGCEMCVTMKEAYDGDSSDEEECGECANCGTTLGEDVAIECLRNADGEDVSWCRTCFDDCFADAKKSGYKWCNDHGEYE